ncbi:bifunctional diguanylate cyclase/phosphodiesterase [Rhodopila sp.]|uniref:bifunctional diguanylate cyclase/phosphodiesterase n=1 Tax=Rhodopila sp. TaxID=2480087 RepID=UPI003D1089FB
MALMLSLVLAAGIAIWQLRQGAVADTEDDNHRLGVVLAEQTTRTLQAVDFVLREMSDKIIDSGVDDLNVLHKIFGGLDVHQALARRLVDLPQVIGFTIVDSSGHLVNLSRKWPVPDYSVADRAYFQYFAATADPNPYISEPAIARTSGEKAIFLVRRITGLNGTFLGVLVAPIRLDYFDTFFAKTGFSDGTGVSIVRRDGLILVHFPGSDLRPGTRIPTKLSWYDLVASGGGHYRLANTFADLGPTFVSVHPLKHYPVVVDVVRTQAAALARWFRQAIAIAAGVLSASISLALLLRALTRQVAISEASQDQISRQVKALQASETLLATTLEHMNQGLIMIDATGMMLICNKRAIELLDLPVDMMAAYPRAADVIEYVRQRDDVLACSEPPLDMGLVLDNQACYERRRPNGTVLEVRTAPLPDGGLVRTFTDITARAAAEAMLGLAASHDQLTGLANRNGFNTRLDATLAAARRGNPEVAVLCLDLDRFKAVNDTLGHDAGDQLLVLAAQRMREIARVTDIIGRLGGDEFAIILPATNLAGAEQVSRRLLESIRMPYILGTERARIGVSIGIAIYPTDGGTAEQLLRNADTALYKAKAAGRNTFCAYATEDGQREQHRVQLEQDFRTAVELAQFSLAYQPICDAATSEPVAFEALLRWNHPKRGAVPPSDFIPIAEQTGLIISLGRWVIEVACAEAAAWALPLRIAINLSPAQFRDQDLLSFIRDVLSRTGLAPTRLDLEVTEGLLLEDVADIVKTMQALRSVGVRMVLDDFGTAHANLSYLRGFPFDAVKIDRSFLRALNSDRQARALVEAMLAMAGALGLDVIGEGVETPEQLTLLCLLQCRWVQGFLLGRPAPSEETRELIWNRAANNPRGDKAVRLPRATHR